MLKMEVILFLEIKRSHLGLFINNLSIYLSFSEYDENFKLLQRQEFNIPDHLMIHDWAFTDTHYILFANRIKLDVIGNYSAIA